MPAQGFPCSFGAGSGSRAVPVPAPALPRTSWDQSHSPSGSLRHSRWPGRTSAVGQPAISRRYLLVTCLFLPCLPVQAGGGGQALGGTSWGGAGHAALTEGRGGMREIGTEPGAEQILSTRQLSPPSLPPSWFTTSPVHSLSVSHRPGPVWTVPPSSGLDQRGRQVEARIQGLCFLRGKREDKCVVQGGSQGSGRPRVQAISGQPGLGRGWGGKSNVGPWVPAAGEQTEGPHECGSCRAGDGPGQSWENGSQGCWYWRCPLGAGSVQEDPGTFNGLPGARNRCNFLPCDPRLPLGCP